MAITPVHPHEDILPATTSTTRHTIMNILLFVLLAAGVANIRYNESSAEDTPSASDRISSITTEFNATKIGLTQASCDAIKDDMTHKQVIAMLGEPTMKSESTDETAGKTEIRQYQSHKGKSIEACTIIFIKERVYSKTRAHYVNGFIMKY